MGGQQYCEQRADREGTTVGDVLGWEALGLQVETCLGQPDSQALRGGEGAESHTLR